MTRIAARIAIVIFLLIAGLLFAVTVTSGAAPVIYGHGGSRQLFAESVSAAIAHTGIPVTVTAQLGAGVPYLPSILSGRYADSLVRTGDPRTGKFGEIGDANDPTGDIEIRGEEYVYYIPGGEPYDSHRRLLLQIMDLLVANGFAEYPRTDLELDVARVPSEERSEDMLVSYGSNANPPGGLSVSGTGAGLPVDLLLRSEERVGFHRIPIRLIPYESFPIAASSIGSGATFSASDVRFEYRPAKNIIPDIVDTAAGKLVAATEDRSDRLDVDGLFRFKSRDTIRRGTVITREMLEPVVMVEKGASVDIVVVKNTVRISFEGTSMQTGYFGDRVDVRIPLVRRELSGVVRGPGEVYVDLE